METILNLLTRDGIVYMAFRPSLTAAQYSTLLDLSGQAPSAFDLRESIRRWAQSEGLQVTFDETETV